MLGLFFEEVSLCIMIFRKRYTFNFFFDQTIKVIPYRSRTCRDCASGQNKFAGSGKFQCRKTHHSMKSLRI